MGSALAENELVSIRNIQPEDLHLIAPHAYSISIVEPLSEMEELKAAYARTGFWELDSGAVSITDSTTGRLLGTCQFFRSGPCIHGLEIGYIIHSETDRRQGFASAGLHLLSNYLFENMDQYHRHQLTIDTSNEASCRVAENCDFYREGILRNCGFNQKSPEDCFVYSRVRTQ